MIKKRTFYERLISLLQGVSWGLVFVGGMLFFTAFQPFGLFIALSGAFIGSLGGLLFVVVFEIAHQQIEKLDEIKKQTKLLEQLVEKGSIL